MGCCRLAECVVVDRQNVWLLAGGMCGCWLPGCAAVGCRDVRLLAGGMCGCWQVEFLADSWRNVYIVLLEVCLYKLANECQCDWCFSPDGV